MSDREHMEALFLSETVNSDNLNKLTQHVRNHTMNHQILAFAIQELYKALKHYTENGVDNLNVNKVLTILNEVLEKADRINIVDDLDLNAQKNLLSIHFQLGKIKYCSFFRQLYLNILLLINSGNPRCLKEQEKHILTLDECLLNTGDYVTQVYIIEIMIQIEECNANKKIYDRWFLNHPNIREIFLTLDAAKFDEECRRILNYINSYKGDNVDSFVASKIIIGDTEVQKPDDPNLFWVDFNLKDRSLSFFCKDMFVSQNSEAVNEWETVFITLDEVEFVKLKEETLDTQCIQIKMKLPVRYLFNSPADKTRSIKGRLIEILLNRNPKIHNSLGTIFKELYINQNEGSHLSYGNGFLNDNYEGENQQNGFAIVSIASHQAENPTARPISVNTESDSPAMSITVAKDNVKDDQPEIIDLASEENSLDELIDNIINGREEPCDMFYYHRDAPKFIVSFPDEPDVLRRLKEEMGISGDEHASNSCKTESPLQEIAARKKSHKSQKSMTATPKNTRSALQRNHILTPYQTNSQVSPKITRSLSSSKRKASSINNNKKSLKNFPSFSIRNSPEKPGKYNTRQVSNESLKKPRQAALKAKSKIKENFSYNHKFSKPYLRTSNGKNKPKMAKITKKGIDNSLSLVSTSTKNPTLYKLKQAEQTFAPIQTTYKTADEKFAEAFERPLNLTVDSNKKESFFFTGKTYANIHKAKKRSINDLQLGNFLQYGRNTPDIASSSNFTPIHDDNGNSELSNIARDAHSALEIDFQTPQSSFSDDSNESFYKKIQKAQPTAHAESIKENDIEILSVSSISLSERDNSVFDDNEAQAEQTLTRHIREKEQILRNLFTKLRPEFNLKNTEFKDELENKIGQMISRLSEKDVKLLNNINKVIMEISRQQYDPDHSYYSRHILGDRFCSLKRMTKELLEKPQKCYEKVLKEEQLAIGTLTSQIIEIEDKHYNHMRTQIWKNAISNALPHL